MISAISLKKLSSTIFILLVIFYACNLFDKSPNVQFPDGGYDFAQIINNRDSTFPFYPLKGKIHPSDSFNYAFLGSIFLKEFNEPNISLRSSPVPVFRFVYECWTQPAVIITFTKNEITIKEGLQVNYLQTSDSALSETEEMLLDIFRRRFPIVKNDTTVLNQNARRQLDSFINLYPLLLNPSYYNTLMQKKYISLKKPFKYSITKIAIAEKKYFELTDLINKLGYWKMPFETPCNDLLSDGFGFYLEANFRNKYNIVRSGSCGDGANAFDSICNAIIVAAHCNRKYLTNIGVHK